MRTLVTAKDEKELKMRVDDLIGRGFKVIQTFEPEQKYGSGTVKTYSGKSKYQDYTGYAKHRTLMERA